MNINFPISFRPNEFNLKILGSLKELRDLFEKNDTIIITYSGGKDSTAVTLLSLILIEKIENEKRPTIYLASVDTLVEIPTIINTTSNFLKSIDLYSKSNKLPVYSRVLTPRVDQRFWVCLIGKGYIPPSYMFRWCVSKLKINPMKNFIKGLGKEVIVLMGIRKDESRTRNRSIKKRYTMNKWGQFEGLPNAKVFLPILDWTTSEVWAFLLSNVFPINFNCENLYKLYFNTRDGCMFKPDGSFYCDGNRFGCWTCTVVKHDKSLERLSDDNLALQYLLNFKKWLLKLSEDDRNRCAFNRKGGRAKGPFVLKTRMLIFDKLKELEIKTKLKLIDQEEENLIKSIWKEDKKKRIFDISFNEINKEVIK